MRRFALVVVILLALTFLTAYLFLSGRAVLLILNKHIRIEVNGAVVRGEMLEGKLSAIVTIREAGKEHSYELISAGDTDMTGDMGSVVDCHGWVAPHSPFLVTTRHFPPCEILQEDGPEAFGWPLISKGNHMEFLTKDRTTVKIWRQ
jgi:hypothetical protein